MPLQISIPMDMPAKLAPTPMRWKGPAPFGDLWAGHHRLIYADPNWLFNLHSAKGEGKSPQAHYDCMPTEEICALPVEPLAYLDCALFLWGTWPMMARGDVHRVARAWGFEPKTGGSWAKLSSTGAKLQFGSGFILRSANEPFLICTRGNPKIRDTTEARSVRNLLIDADVPFTSEWSITAPVREHSRKPDNTIDMIETLFDGPYLELFARTRRRGWSSWGNQVDMFKGDEPA